MAHKTSACERNIATIEEIDELLYRLKYEYRKQDKSLV
jgi:hypothetical protein